jgi:FKBP-type peptidyl-prolyl cis-trans isomerase
MEQRGRVIRMCIAVGAFYAVVTTAGCGGGNGSPEASAMDSTEPGLRSTRPEIKPPSGLPPEEFMIKDMQVGSGTKAERGDEVKIQYYGVDWRGTEHANSWRYEHIPVFELGSHRLLRGLNRGIRGMKEGGSREIIIPYNLVYYRGGHHRHLGPLDTLIYKVYLVKVFKKNHG